MSSQFVTMPCSIGYLRARTPRLACASSPTRWSFLGKSVSVSEATCYAASRQSRGESKLHSAVKLLVHADHDARHLRAPDDGRKDCSGSVVAREPCLPGALMGRETDSKRKTLHHGSFTRPALHMPLPLSTTRATTSSDMANSLLCERRSCPEAGKPKH